MNPEHQLVSLPLSQTVEAILGGFDYIEISDSLATPLFLACQNKIVCYIQFPNDPVNVSLFGEEIKRTRLWRLRDWKLSCERWRQQRIQDQKWRDDYMVEQANIKLVGRKLSAMFCVDPHSLVALSRMILAKKDSARLESIGIKRLYQHVKEIP